MPDSTLPTPRGSDRRYALWARRVAGKPCEIAAYDRLRDAEWEALRLARASGSEGAMSVYVFDEELGSIVWAAGEKAKEITDAGGDVDPQTLRVSAAVE